MGVAIDDTRLRKTGRRIKQAFYQHDPLSPPFHANLMLGLRYLQASLLVPFDRGGKTGARALPVRFECAPVPKRPGKRAGDAEREQYEQARKRCRISQRLVDMMAPLRAALDAAGGIAKKMVLSLDGSFSNRTVFLAPRDRTELIARTRLDAVLCKAAPTGSRRFYGVEKFRPEQVRRDETIVWKTTKLFYAGKRRKIRYKEVNEVYWQGGARRTPLRLLVVAPTPYSKRLSSKMYYRQPAYLLTTDLASQARELLQIYFDEVNHREEKDTLGVGELWSEGGPEATGIGALCCMVRGAERPRRCRNGEKGTFLSGSWRWRKEMVENPDFAGSAGAQTLAGLRRVKYVETGAESSRYAPERKTPSGSVPGMNRSIGNVGGGSGYGRPSLGWGARVCAHRARECRGVRSNLAPRKPTLEDGALFGDPCRDGTGAGCWKSALNFTSPTRRDPRLHGRGDAAEMEMHGGCPMILPGKEAWVHGAVAERNGRISAPDPPGRPSAPPLCG